MKTPRIRTQWEDGNSPMTPTPQPYPAYKPSDVEWHGDVQAHLEVRRTDILPLERETEGLLSEIVGERTL